MTTRTHVTSEETRKAWKSVSLCWPARNCAQATMRLMAQMKSHEPKMRARTTGAVPCCWGTTKSKTMVTSTTAAIRA